MGTCDSSQEARHKLISSQNFNSSLTNNSFSSSSLPVISSKNIFEEKSDLMRLKNSSSNLSTDSSKYILSKEITKREDITKKYKLGKIMLGDGATSLVYVAENFEKKKFAIKRISKGSLTLPRRNSVVVEARVCQKLKNERIIKYYEIYEDLNYINIVMELGHTDLFELIMNSPSYIIPEDIAIEFLIEIFESIDYLHSEKIIHCDIKPENYVVIFDKKKNTIPHLKLIDFGNIRKMPQNKGQKLFNFSGTKEYMAPEALDNTGFDEKIDEWAAGIIMYNMLTGIDPFNAEDDMEYKDNIKFKEIKFNYIKNEKLRELNKKLLNRYAKNRISVKEALQEIKIIKEEKNNIKNNNNSNINDNNNKNDIKEIDDKWNIIKNKISLVNLY